MSSDAPRPGPATMTETPARADWSPDQVTSLLATTTHRLLAIAAPTHGPDRHELVRRRRDREIALGAQHLDSLGAAHELALAALAHGHLRAAVGELEQVHGRCVEQFGPDHPDVLIVRGNLALARLAAGLTDIAVAELTSLCRDRRRILGPDHPSSHNAVLALAMAYRADGQHERADEVLDPTHRRLVELHDRDHPLVRFSEDLLDDRVPRI